MKKIILVIFILLPSFSYAQVNNNSSANENTNLAQNKFSKANTILICSAIPWAPFGIKYQYCKTLGAYVSYSTDFNLIDEWKMITFGVTKTLGPKSNFYLGFGLNSNYSTYISNNKNFSEKYLTGVLEGGIVIKFGMFALDLGGGFVSAETGFGSVGIGVNF